MSEFKAPVSQADNERVVQVAGRALDAEVAEKVMGWVEVRGGPLVREYSYPGITTQRGAAFYEGPSGYPPTYDAEDGCHVDVPNFSTEIAQAFKVVEAMRAKVPPRFQNLWLVVYSYNRTYATFAAEKGISGDDWTEANGEHATPLAICLAALDAVKMSAADGGRPVGPPKRVAGIQPSEPWPR